MSIDQTVREDLRAWVERKSAVQKLQVRKTASMPPVTVAAGAGVSAAVVSQFSIFEVGADGWFYIKEITATIAVAAGAYNQLAVGIKDLQTGYDLFEPFVSIANFATPGVRGQNLFAPYRFEHFLAPGQQLRLEFINRDTVNPATVELTFHGWKILSIL